MDALYMRGQTILTADEKTRYRRFRVESAAAFGGIASGVEFAVVAGDFPDIIKALSEAEVKYKKVELSADKEAREAKESKAKAAEETAQADSGNTQKDKS